LTARDFSQPKDFKVIENQAHRFAAAFLLPAQSFVQSIWAPTLDALRVQKETWRVSIKGMIVRCRQLRLVDDSQYERLLINYSRRFRTGEPGDDALTPEKPRLLARCFEMLIEQRIKTRARILADLSMKSSDVEELAALPRGYLSGDPGEVVDLPKLRTRTIPRDAQSNGLAQVISLPFKTRG
jgi:Zn-dependent peptidase ImmA (M78 family)